MERIRLRGISAGMAIVTFMLLFVVPAALVAAQESGGGQGPPVLPVAPADSSRQTGALQPPVEQAQAQAQEAPREFMPLDIMLVLDNSGSMRTNDPGYLVPDMVERFVQGLGPDDRLGVVIFDSTGRLVARLGTRAELMYAGVMEQVRRKLDYSGLRTDIGRALERAIAELREEGRKEASRGIILLTDGKIDTGDKYQDVEERQEIREIQTLDARKNGIRICGIAFTEEADYPLLQTLAVKTDGTYFRALTVQEISPVLDKLHAALQVEVKREEPVAKQAGVNTQLPEPPVSVPGPVATNATEGSGKGVKSETGKVKAEESNAKGGEAGKAEGHSVSVPDKDNASGSGSNAENGQRGKNEKEGRQSVQALLSNPLVYAGIGVVLFIIGGIVFWMIRSGNKRRETVVPDPGRVDPQAPEVIIEYLGLCNNAAQAPEFTEAFPVGERFTFRKNDIKMGRQLSHGLQVNDLPIPDPTMKVSKEHAKLYVNQGELYLMDLNSTNGTWVINRRLEGGESILVKSGTEFSIYQHTFRLLIEGRPGGATGDGDDEMTVFHGLGPRADGQDQDTGGMGQEGYNRPQPPPAEAKLPPRSSHDNWQPAPSPGPAPVPEDGTRMISEAMCPNHPSRQASHLCVRCGGTFCSECGTLNPDTGFICNMCAQVHDSAPAGPSET